MDLEGTWRAVEADDDLRRTWLDPASDDLGHWVAVPVPGHWRSTPEFAASDGPLLYRVDFDHPEPAPDERLWLCFDGLFYQGDVWLDGGYVGDTEGYFFRHAFEVTEACRDRSAHVLGVELACSPPSDRTQKSAITGEFQDSHSIDPAWNPGGIWRPVRLERSGPIRIIHSRILCADAASSRAHVRFRVVLDAAEAGEIMLRSTVGGVEMIDHRRVAAGENQVTWTMRIDDPALWWPHALGAPTLLEATVEVTALPDALADATPDEARQAGVPPSHRISHRIGLRQVRLTNWNLSVNGERLFLKGVNAGPTRRELG